MVNAIYTVATSSGYLSILINQLDYLVVEIIKVSLWSNTSVRAKTANSRLVRASLQKMKFPLSKPSPI